MDAWWNRYVGIPFAPGGNGVSGCDCWGLVRLVYRREFRIELPGVILDVEKGSVTDAAFVSPMLDLVRDAFWERVSVPSPGDVAVFRVRGYDSHVGLVTVPGYMLHVREGKDAVIEAYDRRFWKNAFRGVYRYRGHEAVRGLANPERVTLVGKPSVFAPRVTLTVPPGSTLADIVSAICDEAEIPEPMRRAGTAFLNYRQVPFADWGNCIPQAGDVVFFRMFPSGSKTFKFIAGLALVLTAVAITVYTGGTAGAALSGAVKFGLGSLSLGLNMAGMFLINSSMQKSMPSIDNVSLQQSQFLNGGSNALPTYKVIPQVLGIGRMTLYYLATPYTERADQYTNYLRAAYTAGYGPVEISDVRNGDTPIGKYREMEYKIYRGRGGDQTPSLFTRDAWEDSPQITLKKGEHNYRQTGDNVDQIQIVLYYPEGLWYRTSAGKIRDTESSGVIRWRALPDGSWNELQKHIAPRSFTLPSCSPTLDAELVYDEDGSLSEDDFWLNTYGVPKKLVSEEVTIELYRWYTFAFSTETGTIVMHQGTATDNKDAEPSPRLLELMTQSKQLWNSSSYIGRLAPIGDNEELLAYVCVKGDAIVDVQDKRDSTSVEGCALTTNGMTVSFAAGSRLNAGSSSWYFAHGNQTRAFTKIYTFDVPRGRYEIDVRLTSADDEVKSSWKGSAGLRVLWQTLRTFTWGTPFTPRKPLAWLEMRVKASDQLNGTLDLINAAVKSLVPDYDYKTKKWVTRVSSNPASLFRYVLQGPAMSEAYRVPDSRLDLVTLERWHNYCRTQGFTYFKVVGGDEGMSVYDLLVEIAAAGRAKPLLRVDSGGMWTVLIDEPKTQVTQLFTEHNSWGWNWTKSAVEPPHAVRATFVDKTKGYEQNTVTVYADGYSSANATKYENWGMEYFEGVTEVKNIQRIVRRAIAYSILRSEHLSFYVAQEHLVSELGDLVMCENSFVQWGLGSGWIEEVLMEGDACVGLKLSADVSLYPDTEYGIRVRRANARGTSVRFDIAGVDTATQTREVRFAAAVSENIPAEGDLYQFGYRQRESHQCIIEAIKPEADGIAQITVCDYAPELLDIDDTPLPPYQSDISTPQPLPSSYIGHAPVFALAYSDERAIVVNPDGSLLYRIAVQWKNPAGLERHATMVQLRYAQISGNGDRGSWMLGEPVALAVGTAYCTPVEEGGRYRIEARYTSDSGVVGPWELMQGAHEVVGRTLEPPDVENLTVRLNDPLGITLAWDAVDAPDLSHYEITGSISGRSAAPEVTLPAWNITGELSFAVVAVDSMGLKSETPATASIAVQAPAAPVFQSVRLLDEGVVAVWKNAKTSWSIERYVLSLGDLAVSVRSLSAVLNAPSPFMIGQSCTIMAQDVFGNVGETSDPFTVDVFPPKTPSVKLGFNKLTGAVTVDWQDCRNDVQNAPAIACYQINGTLANQQSTDGLVTVQGTHYEAVVPLTAYEYGSREDEDGTLINVGTLSVTVTAVDKYGITNRDAEDYRDNTVQFAVWPPYNPTNMAIASSEEGDSIILTWKDCTRIFAIDYYIVTDSMTGRTYKVSTNYVVLPPRKEGSYPVTVQAYDVIGHSSAAMTYNMTVAGVGGMTVTAKVDGSDILVEWSIPESAFVVDHYIIKSDNDVIPDEDNIDFEDGDLVGTAKVNYLRVPAGAAGTYVFYVWAVDVAGNISTDYASYAAVSVEEPLPPTVNSVLEGDGLRLSWEVKNGPGCLPVATWDVIRQWEDAEGQTQEEDYGRLDVTSVAVPAVTAGDHTFLVRAIDSGGNVGPWGYVDFTAQAPGRVTFTQPTVIDNNVQLYWTPPNRIFFPIKEYIFSEIDEDGYEMEIGRVDALFASETESESGMFTYGITPVDTGGNTGQRTTITCRVAQPPDFVFYDKVDSLFNGTKTNLVLDGQGHMLGPVPSAETWEENAERVIEEASLSATTASLTHQQKVNAGFKTWLEPRAAKGMYVEAIDHGSLIPNSNITVTLGYEVLRGTPEITCKIETSQDKKQWEIASDNAFSVYVSQFRYTRITLTITGGYVQINSLLVDLNVKQITDGGRVECKATDNGEGFVSETSTPMLTGTWVAFTRSFVDVQSLPQPNVVNNQGYTAFTVFEDVINPKGFRIFVKDKNGTRVTAQVDWIALGV